MEIKTINSQNNKINIFDVKGNMNARDSEDLMEYLFDCLDKGKNLHLINCAHVKKIDGLGINTICYFINRGMHISLFNVHSEVRGMLALSGKKNFIHIINETEIDKVISILENKILEKETSVDSLKTRLNTRINTSIPAKLSYYKESNDEVKATANISNLSEGGMRVEQIEVSNTKAGEYGNETYIKELDIHDIKFELNGYSEIIETDGICIWKSNRFNNLSAGIRFKEMNNESKSMVNKYVNKSSNIEE